MDSVAIEVTNLCHNQCSNCTRLVGHHAKPYMMSMADFARAVDTMVTYPKITGMLGGEPLLHPKFTEMCEYLGSKIPPERCGLWSCFPPGKEHYREIICKTFGHVFINDHTRDDILHKPVLVAADELNLEPWSKWYMVNHCWVQNYWSACVNPNGVFFCEVAGAMSMLMGQGKPGGGVHAGWPVEPGWWTRSPMDYIDQMRQYCMSCGAAMPIRARCSTDIIDDISPGMLEKLRELKSPKVSRGQYEVHDLAISQEDRPSASYKDLKYRDAIAARYGIFLSINDLKFQTPYLKRKWSLGEAA
jgi:hypothetical protein